MVTSHDQPAIPDGGLVRLRLDIAYDGTDFAGWATQVNQRTVAGVLGEAFTTIVGDPVQLYAAGRTDAGVHATGQVAHLDVPVACLPGLRGRYRPQAHRNSTGWFGGCHASCPAMYACSISRALRRISMRVSRAAAAL